jgi:hypothetical protein
MPYRVVDWRSSIHVMETASFKQSQHCGLCILHQLISCCWLKSQCFDRTVAPREQTIMDEVGVCVQPTERKDKPCIYPERRRWLPQCQRVGFTASSGSGYDGCRMIDTCS